MEFFLLRRQACHKVMKRLLEVGGNITRVRRGKIMRVIY